MTNFDKISDLASKLKTTESGLLNRALAFEAKLLDSIGDNHLSVRSHSVNLNQIGLDDWVYGYLTFSQGGLHVAYRSTDTDYDDHLNGVPEIYQSYSHIKIEDAEISWVKELFNKKNCDRLFIEIEKALTVDIENMTQVTEEVPISSEVSVTEVNDDVLEAIHELNSNNLLDQWLKARTCVELDPAESITRTSRYLESLCRKILEDRDVELPKKKDMANYLKVVAQHTSMASDREAHDDLVNIMGAVRGIFQQIGTLRTHFGTAHGSGESDYRPTPEMARLANSLAAATSNFLIHRHIEMMS